MAHILILGAGYGGLRTARELAKHASSDTQIDLVNDSELHVEKTGLHTIAAGTRKADAISFKITDVIPSKVNFIKATVSNIDVDNKKVSFSDHDDMTYDYVVVALGFRSEDFGLEGASENALILESVKTAEKIYDTIEKNISNYKTSNDPADLSIVVCGAGFTGIEMLGELVDSKQVLKAKYNVPDITVTCLEKATSILPMFDSELAKYAVNYLTNHGINIITGADIKKINKGSVEYQMGDETKEVKASSIVWTVGVSGSDVIKASGFDARRNRVMTTSYLNLEDHPEAFFIGDDSAMIPEGQDRPLPTTGQLATAQGTITAQNIANAINDKPLVKFVYKSKGTVASLGQNHGIAELPSKMKFRGHIASFMKHMSADVGILEVAGLKTAFRKGTL
ncbi:NAD(P)/FAD-dependent oxidoreductase [Lactobacillus terrae]|uniref:NAD(P)/FAD-dependent oxidoreductase n=1 Tax=Lactobacillus terrae TaxID=2269374 RepID=UPI000C1B6807|nr:NAD(P)/FAD-dependent oxidoreductase [Lactobacillus terrae]